MQKLLAASLERFSLEEEGGGFCRHNWPWRCFAYDEAENRALTELNLCERRFKTVGRCCEGNLVESGYTRSVVIKPRTCTHAPCRPACTRTHAPSVKAARSSCLCCWHSRLTLSMSSEPMRISVMICSRVAGNRPFCHTSIHKEQGCYKRLCAHHTGAC